MNNRDQQRLEQLAETMDALRAVKGGWPGRVWERMMLAPRRIFPMGLLSTHLNPFELFFLLALVVLGMSYGVFRVTPPGSLSTLLPPIATTLWGITLSVGSVCAMAGGLWPRKRDLENALSVYQFGWGLVGTACLVYGIALMVVFPVIGLFTYTINMTLAAACLARVMQVSRFFRLTRMFLKYQLKERTSDVDAPPDS